jgi:hypothetical protein
MYRPKSNPFDNNNDKHKNVTFPTDNEHVSLLLFGDTDYCNPIFNSEQSVPDNITLKLIEKRIQKSIDDQKVFMEENMKLKKRFEQQQELILLLKERIEALREENKNLRESIMQSLK